MAHTFRLDDSEKMKYGYPIDHARKTQAFHRRVTNLHNSKDYQQRQKVHIRLRDAQYRCATYSFVHKHFSAHEACYIKREYYAYVNVEYQDIL